MSRRYYERLDEHLLTRTLPNGLRVMVVPKPAFSRKCAYFVTDFGAVHRRFRLDGREYNTPAGVAHFLEHKLFDLPGRDVSAEFAAMGASVNAFTSYDLTAYYFSCTENFEPSLRLLLEFVSTPYFTRESVKKEQGIIDQEIAMSADEPGSRVYENLMGAMYRRHPIRTPILGTCASIRRIGPGLLHTCHRAFYAPENMLLCVVGDVDGEQVCQIARQVLGDDRRPAAEKLPFPEEKLTCPRSYTGEAMDIPMRSFCIGFKCPPTQPGVAGIRQEIVGDLACEVLFGESSSLYLQLYEQGLIDSSFGGGFEVSDGCAMITCGGDGDDPRAVREALLAHRARLLREGLPDSQLQRLLRSALGRRIRDLDSFSSTCFRLCAYRCSDFDYFDFPTIYESVTTGDILRFLEENIRRENCAISVIDPIQEATI